MTTSGSPARILIWPGTAVAVGGMFVWAVATAFYYHFGASCRRLEIVTRASGLCAIMRALR